MEYNNDFLSFLGRISRKNYTINMLILVALYISISLVNFDNFSRFYTSEIIDNVLIFVIELFKFVVIVAIMSVIYRRMADFSNLNDNMKKIFFILFFFPFLYINWGHYLLSFLPFLINILDLITGLILLPLAVIASIIFAFLKSRN